MPNTMSELDKILMIWENMTNRVLSADAEAPLPMGELKKLLLAYHQQLEAKKQLQPIPMTNGLDCPACGHPTLMLGNGGYVTCSLEGCTNPDYAEAAEAKVAEARVEQTLLLQSAEKKFGKIDFNAALYELKPRNKIVGYNEREAK